VFVPDIIYKTGGQGQSAYNAVISAADFISKMKFADTNKMAIQGQSWGGYEVAFW